jgi:hypothetical protein
VWISGVGEIGDAGACIARPIVRWDGAAFDLAIPTGGTTHRWWRLDAQGTTLADDPGVHEQTSAGFSHFNGDLPVIYPEQGLYIGTRWFGTPCLSADVTVGQDADKGLLLSTRGIIQMLDPDANPAMEPHVVGDSERCLVVARLQTAFGATRFYVCGPPYEGDPIVIAPLLPPPDPPPTVVLTVEPPFGPAPLAVTAHATLQYATTWRWLLDGVIVGSEGAAHAYWLDAAGEHRIAVRALGTGGTMQTPDVIVHVTTPPPVVVPSPPASVTGWRGITAGFGGLLGAELLAQIKARGWEVIRQDGQWANQDQLAAMVGEIRAAGLRPLVLCLASQFADMPEGIDVEPRADVDRSVGGLEPNFTNVPATYAQIINSAMPVARARGLRVWAGMVNTDAAALAWLSTMVTTLEPDCGISLHPYPLASASGYYSRALEIVRFKALIGARPFIVGEWGWQQGPRKAWWQYLFGGHSHPSDTQILAAVQGDFAAWRAAGAQVACLYQLNDGPRCPQHTTMPATAAGGYGIRRADGTWKPTAGPWAPMK